MNRQLITYKSLLPVQTNPATSDDRDINYKKYLPVHLYA